MTANGHEASERTRHADETQELLEAVQALIIPFIRQADDESSAMASGRGLAVDGQGHRTSLVEMHPPKKLESMFGFDLPAEAGGKEGLIEEVKKVLHYSVNTWDQGFLDKLYASTNAVGVVSELLLSVLNTNVHVYQVSPALTIIEKHTARRLAQLFGFTGAHAGGICQPGGSASNSSSVIIARNTLYPETKDDGLGGRRFVLFTSAHGHYSLEKAAQIHGFGRKAVRSVPVDDAGRMIPSALRQMVERAKADDEVPFYVNATAGTTVLGSFDPFEEVSAICKEHGLWMHVDGSWGGSVVFNEEIAKTRLAGVELADSIAINPHKMLGAPVTCSFLLGRDMRQFWKAMTLPAGYLFHNTAGDDIYDLADLTPQCGRRGDALKLFLSWTYYGTSGLSDRIATAYARAQQLYDLVDSSPNFVMVSPDPNPCLQVCFYYAPNGKMAADGEATSRRTREIVERCISRGWMFDYAPGERGKFFRVVVNAQTLEGTVTGLVKAIEEVGQEVLAEEGGEEVQGGDSEAKGGHLC